MSGFLLLPKGAIVDAHLHLDDRLGQGTARNAASSGKDRLCTADQAAGQLVQEMQTCNVGHAVVLHLLWQPWSVEDVAEALAGRPMLTGFVNVDPRSPTALDDVKKGYDLGFRGLKLHPRIQRYRPDDEVCIAVVRRAGELGMPSLIDCFPDGDWIMAGLDVRQYAALAAQAPDSQLIVAHSAGHHCLDLLMLAKRVKNLWFDVSYSLLYYDTPVTESLFYALKSIRYERVLFGTDYPDRPLKTSVDRSLVLLDKFGVAGEDRAKLLWENALELLRLKPSA